MFAGVFSWWSLLCVVAALNVGAWVLSADALRQRQSTMSAQAYTACYQMLLLSAGYVFGCAFRSALPVFDIPRLSLFDTWLSSALVGRSVATFAELCFVAQWALMLGQITKTGECATVSRVARVIVPLILVAEVCSWYSVLTTANIGHVIEETLWGASALLVVVALLVFHPRCPAKWRPALLLAIVAGIPYAAYMFLVDVPMYWRRWLADEASGRVYLSISQGLADAFERRIVAHSWEIWRGEVMWMTLYFSVGVWISILLVHAAMAQVRGVAEPRRVPRAPTAQPSMA